MTIMLWYKRQHLTQCLITFYFLFHFEIGYKTPHFWPVNLANAKSGI